MNKLYSLGSAKVRPAAGVASRETPSFQPVATSPWIAMSTMQKAIRRGRERLAVAAAATLLRESPDRFWRRAGVIVFEDIGIADLECVSIVTACLAGKKFREKLGGEWPVASFVTTLMANARKSRAADDLLVVSERDPDFEPAREELASAPLEVLLEITASGASLTERAIALHYACGTSCWNSITLKERKGEARRVFDHLLQSGIPAEIVQISAEGFRRTGQALAPMVALLSPYPTDANASTSDEFPAECMCGDAPSFAIDYYTREGRQALQRLLREKCETSRWVRERVPIKDQLRFLGDALFYAEGGLLKTSRRPGGCAEQIHRNRSRGHPRRMPVPAERQSGAGT